MNADGSLRRLLRESIRKPNEFAGILQARNLALSLGERFADINEHDGGHLIVADLDRERIHRKPVLSGLINEYPRAT